MCTRPTPGCVTRDCGDPSVVLQVAMRIICVEGVAVLRAVHSSGWVEKSRDLDPDLNPGVEHLSVPIDVEARRRLADAVEPSAD